MEKLKLLLIAIAVSFTSLAYAQNTVSGVVVDNQNMPIPGVNVVKQGTTTGTSTNSEGKFQIGIKNGDVLTFSFIGYESQNITYSGQSSLNVEMIEDAANLEEIVVIGYGTVKRTDLTGAVASLGNRELTSQKKTDLGQALQGRVAGVDVRTTNNKPGAPLSIDIRGNTVIQNTNESRDGLSDNLADDLSKPLYVVDGVFFDDINILNPADIQQMDILKDASATAIYGARGANGVVIITTKNGIEGRTQFSYDATFGVNTAANVPDMLDGDQFVNFADNVLRSSAWKGMFKPGEGVYPTVEDYNNAAIDLTTEFRATNEEASNVANRRYTDWQNDYLKSGIQTSHTLGMSGGSNGLTYNASAGYLSNKGVIGIESYDRFNLSTSLTKKVSNKFTLGVKAYLSLSDRETGSNELFRSTLRLSPTVNSFNPDGSVILFPDDQDGRFLNPIYESQGSWLSNTKTLDVITNAFLNYKPTKWLSLKTQFAPNLSNDRYGSHFGLLTKSARNEESRTRAYYNSNFKTSYTWDNIADLNFDVAEGHSLNATLISSMYYNQREGSAIETRDFDTDAYQFYNAGAGLDVRAYNTYFYKETLASFAGRLNYGIQDKYLFTFTGRYDGSSKLAPGYKWNFFPSAAFAWKASDEAFLQEADWLNNLKVRLSYGESGNEGSIRAYQSLAFLGGSDYLFGNSHVNGVNVSGLPNYELTWERSKEFNFGVDMSMLQYRLGLSLEIYNKKTVDAILGRTLSPISGYGSATGNYGSVRNSGVELTLNTVNAQTNNFKWTTSINFAKNKNQILKLDGGIDKFTYGNHGVRQVGQPVDAIYGYEIEGIWQLAEAAEAFAFDGSFPGQYKYSDLDNNGSLTEDDKKVIGSLSPDWIGGMTNTFTYNNFNLNIQMHTRQGVYGHSEFYNNFVPWQNDDAKFNKVDLDYWTPNNPGSVNPAPEYGSTGNNYYTDFNFVKVGNIGLGYTASSTLLDKLKINSLRLTLDVQNPFTFTDYAGPDPETGMQNSYNAGYMIKTVLFGLKVTY
ncbi:SusC/RagA family TonB-linked outer membrane protein [Arcticibacterium luteifluviistationis]|nr:TonB-dependent receptor [Arcticibacterium luteifluviistationis]